MSVLPSREVRIQAGVTENFFEDALLRAHQGPTSELVPLINHSELYIEYLRSKAAEEVGQLLIIKLTQEGYLTVDGVKETLRDWHETEAA